MRSVKILIVLLFFTYTALAKIGLELGIFVPLGMGVSIHSYEDMENLTAAQEKKFQEYIDNNKRRSRTGLEAGFLFNIGYKLDIDKKLGFSFLAELGYSRDVYNFRLKDSNDDSTFFKMKNYQYYKLDSLVLGLFPKFNYDKFSFGIGFGMKIILNGTIDHYSYNPALSYSDRNIQMISTKNYKDYFKSNIIPYLKFTFDYSVYSTEKFDIALGLYIGGDFAIKYREVNAKIANLPEFPTEKLSSFDIGFQIGTKIRPLN